MKIKVKWDLDDLTPEEAGVPEIVELPEGIRAADIAEYLSNTFGWRVLVWRLVPQN